jgi:hypothetical protein
MRIWFIPLVAAVAACAAPPQLGTTPESSSAGSTTPPEKVTEVKIESFADVANCRRYVPTGTRIAGERCESPGDDTAAEAAEYEIMRRDVESMRSQQVYREQARQAAEAAIRRGAR